MNILDQLPLSNGYQHISVGGLVIKSGFVTAGDPFTLPDAPLKTKLIPGKYQVELIYKDCHEWGYRVAFAMLIINNEKVVEWKPLENTYGFDSIFVDSGLASFSDSETARLFTGLLQKWKEDTPARNYYDSVLKNEILRKVTPGDRTNSFCMHYPFNDDENIAIFECGIGDGDYRIYHGVGENNEPSMVLIDFDILDWV